MSVPNQKKVIIKKEICDKKNLYATINMNALEKAMNDLSGEAFKLWIYFSKNQNNYTFDLSQKAAEKYGIKKSTYYDNIKVLIKKGYLQQREENSNIYYFTEIAFSEIRKQEEQKEYIISEIRKDNSENWKEFSEKEQRNNINTLQNNINKKGGKAANNLDIYCKELLNNINTDYINNKFNETELKEITELKEYLFKNAEIETTENLYKEILKVYLKLYK